MRCCVLPVLVLRALDKLRNEEPKCVILLRLLPPTDGDCRDDDDDDESSSLPSRNGAELTRRILGNIRSPLDRTLGIEVDGGSGGGGDLRCTKEENQAGKSPTGRPCCQNAPGVDSGGI